ncbi:MAG: hypothetical protein WA139_01035 [Candidatus Aenigmatarchaeota archaeon]
MIRTETMKIFLEALMKNHSGLRRFEIKNKTGLSEEAMSNCIMEGTRNGSIEEIESRFFITQQVGVGWLNRNSFTENTSVRNYKEDSYQTVGFILPSSNYTSSPTQVASTVTAIMLNPNQIQIEKLKEKVIYEINYLAQILAEKSDCQELSISTNVVRNASTASSMASSYIFLKQNKK